MDTDGAHAALVLRYTPPVPKRQALEIRMSARAVVAMGQPFAPWGTSFADAGVALDEIADLSPHAEPLVLRVAASGGTKEERAKVAGDWLCDTDGSSPRRTPQPRWRYPRPAEAYTKHRTWLEAWEDCDDGWWMLHAAAIARTDARMIVRAACACADSAMRLNPGGSGRLRVALGVARAWTRGTATTGDVREAALTAQRDIARYEDYSAINAVNAAIDARDSVTAMAMAAAQAAEVAVDSAARAARARVLGHDGEAEGATERQIQAAGLAAAEARETARREMVELVREHVPTIAVLRAVVARG